MSLDGILTATILRLSEILKQRESNNLPDGSSVRVTGRICGVDGTMVTLEEEGASLSVDTTLLPDDVPLHVGTLVQFLGEIGTDENANETVVRALVFRAVEGLDLDVFYKAVALRNEVLSDQQPVR